MGKEIKSGLPMKALHENFELRHEMMTIGNISNVMRMLFQVVPNYFNKRTCERIVKIMTDNNYDYDVWIERERSNSRSYLRWITVRHNNLIVFEGKTFNEGIYSAYSTKEFAMRNIKNKNELMEYTTLLITLMRNLSVDYMDAFAIEPTDDLTLYFNDKNALHKRVIPWENFQNLFDEEDDSVITSGDGVILPVRMDSLLERSDSTDIVVPWAISANMINLNTKFAPLESFAEFLPNDSEKYTYQRGYIFDRSIYSQQTAFFILYKNRCDRTYPILAHISDIAIGSSQIMIFTNAVDDFWEFYYDMIINNLD